jgi:superoxide dismutase
MATMELHPRKHHATYVANLNRRSISSNWPRAAWKVARQHLVAVPNPFALRSATTAAATSTTRCSGSHAPKAAVSLRKLAEAIAGISVALQL